MELDELFTTVNDDATAAHMAHLSTDNFATHKALGAFYSDVRDALDSFVEAAVGLDSTKATLAEDDEIAKLLENTYGDLVDMRTEVCEGNLTLENKFDELTAVYLKALYMLRMS